MRTWTSPPTASCGRPLGPPGQRCTACSRVVVQDSVADALVQRLVDRAAALRLGPGGDPRTEVGPLINAAALDKVAGYVQVGRDEGASFLTGGERATGPGLEHGHFFQPTVFDRVDPMCRLGQEEIFGPLLSVIRVPTTTLPYGRQSGPLRPVLEHLHPRCERRVPGDARPRRPASCMSMRAPSAPRRTCRSVALARPVTATARRVMRPSIRSRSGNRCTSTTRGRLQRAQIDNQPA